MTFITATTMPLLIALAEIGLQGGVMLPANAAAMVGAGVLSVLIYPAVAVGLARRDRQKAGLPRVVASGANRTAEIDVLETDDLDGVPGREGTATADGARGTEGASGTGGASGIEEAPGT